MKFLYESRKCDGNYDFCENLGRH